MKFMEILSNISEGQKLWTQSTKLQKYVFTVHSYLQKHT